MKLTCKVSPPSGVEIVSICLDTPLTTRESPLPIFPRVVPFAGTAACVPMIALVEPAVMAVQVIPLWVLSESETRRELPKDGPINVGLPDMLSIDEVKEDALKLNMKLDKWAFSLKNIVHQRFNTKLKDITKKKDIDNKE